ncbi:MAG: hypothetical protein AAGG01_08205 [Planctomycetota bacterium]
MNTPVLPFLLAAATAATTFGQSATDKFDSDVTPGFRGEATALYAGWDAFTIPFGGTNAPDDPASDAQATVEQTTPGAIITSTMNIYHPSGVPAFIVAATTPMGAQEVVFQIRTLGNQLDDTSFMLEYEDMGGATVSLAPSSFQILQSGGFATEKYASFDLSGQTEDVTDFRVVFEGADNNVSCDAILLDNDMNEEIGTEYCNANPNSTGMIGRISASGSDAVADNNLTLNASDLPNNVFGFFLVSQTQADVANPGGSAGVLCLGGSVGRYSNFIFNTGAGSTASLAIDLGAIAQPMGPVAGVAGETWNFQCWHRDVGTSNLTTAVEITLQ